MREQPSWWGVYLRGVAMGAADVVPGVSGGTMALVLGVYERLVRALRSATGSAPWRAIKARDLRGAFAAADGPFLLPLGAGIATAVLLLAKVLETAMAEQRVLMYAAFFGLVAASVAVVGRRVGERRPGNLLLGLGAAVATFLLLGAAPARMPEAAYFLVLSGAVGITALVLPGVSGATLLVLLGQYETLLGAIGRADLGVLAPFALGALIGLATVARAMEALLRRAQALTLAALTGAMLGSLRRLWPWTEEGTTPAATAAGPLDTVPALPVTAWGAEGWLNALLVALAAAGLVALLEWGGRRRADRGGVSPTS